ncbi:MAG: sigma-54 dependent transcriptional regulator [Bacteroidota bacterium]
MLGKLLIIDDDLAVLESLELLLRGESGKVVTLSDPNRLYEALERNSFDAVLLDMNFKAGRNTGNEGIFWLREILKKDADLSVIMITAFGEVEQAVKAMKMGAFDFLQKPWKSEKLIASLNAACQLSSSKRKVRILESEKDILQEDVGRQYPEIIGQSPRIREVHQIISKVAKTDSSVLIQGGNGTGKELIAWEIHSQSKRRNQLFVTVDLGAISSSLFESELFGHKKGAFTDAKTDRKGRFEAASGGTLFLDEIGNIPLHLQSKLLSVLQNREIFPVGANAPVPIDVRIISATNKDLAQLVNKGLFREDLYYRINTIFIESPDLKDRDQDIGLLAENFLEKFSVKYDKPKLRLSAKALDKLCRHSWPGNIRELLHAMENLAIMSESDTILPEDINLSSAIPPEASGLNLENIEKSTIRKALTKYSGNYTTIASELGISRTTLYHKIRKYGI